MNKAKKNKRAFYLWKRDGERCGMHMDGCGEKMTLEDMTVDHIIPKHVMRVFQVPVHTWSNLDNLQGMHLNCNMGRRFPCEIMMNETTLPEFKCKCHVWKMEGTKIELYKQYARFGDGWKALCLTIYTEQRLDIDDDYQQHWQSEISI